VCSEQADDNEVSFSSLGTEIGNIVSYGENRSVMAWKWTVTRAIKSKFSKSIIPNGKHE
jgi:hypothetical protein